jgi:hypothetical protein
MSERGKALAKVEAKLHLMKMVELRAIANAHGIPVERKKDRLIKNIMASIEANALWVPGLEPEIGYGPTGLPVEATQKPAEFSVKVARIMQARAEGREL